MLNSRDGIEEEKMKAGEKNEKGQLAKRRLKYKKTALGKKN